MVGTTFDEPDDGLPRVLADRVAAFPVGAVSDEADRLAATAEEMEQIGVVLDELAVVGEQRRRLMQVYLQKLYARLEEAGKWSRSHGPGLYAVTVSRRRGAPRPVLRATAWLRSRMADPARTWVSNRRVGWRRRRWRRLLTR